MIGYVLVGTNDFARAGAFYDELLSSLDAKRSFATERMVMWSSSTPGRPGFGIVKPFDGKAATVSNGGMISLAIDAPQKVDALHKKALELGGTDEGAPGPRGGGAFYSAYFRDLDGNKLCLFCMVRK